ncbi:hypothetical protein [Bacillus subtilis]|uniref:hypothetical protein n=1 Tax=Bacillus subtilis TaxID=1423 RepID=UPI00129DD136|nr:hypothetical protein [Bacillus subtilis]NRF01914.1 hypothetical protein [Bacillus subtilis]NRG37180.1 hypothetical protein [Bacillus subtilis]QGI31230.1 hypothetical protein GII85_11515 [Bacillus subtilis]WHX51884.1 hypothetical protein QNH30_11620 [Bacillus subtilis]WHX55886.1 hypothetical protein QNK02_11620 [Bacillus subtilis]
MKFIGKELKLWEIMKDGKQGEVYEITDCALVQYIGTQVKVEETQDYRGKYKTLVKPETKGCNSDASNIVTIFGCMGTATWRQVLTDPHKKISVHEAINRLNEGKTIYYKNGDNYQKVRRYTSFCSLGIDDFSDLIMRAQFYKKEVI